MTDVFADMASTSTMIKQAEARGDMKMAAAAKKESAEARKLYDAGKRNEALARLVRSMEMVLDRRR